VRKKRRRSEENADVGFVFDGAKINNHKPSKNMKMKVQQIRVDLMSQNLFLLLIVRFIDLLTLLTFFVDSNGDYV
jgi:hypothetical protein